MELATEPITLTSATDTELVPRNQRQVPNFASGFLVLSSRGTGSGDRTRHPRECHIHRRYDLRELDSRWAGDFGRAAAQRPRLAIPTRAEVIQENDTGRSIQVITHLASRRSGHLLRILGVTFGIAVGVGNTIGTGIFRTPGGVAGCFRVSPLERSRRAADTTMLGEWSANQK